MSNQTSEAFAYIEQEYKDAKGRVELQRRVVEQLHMVEADAVEAEASLNALLDDEASKLRILDYLRKWLGGRTLSRLTRKAFASSVSGPPFILLT